MKKTLVFQRFRLHFFVAFPAGSLDIHDRRIQEIVLKKISLVGASSRPKILPTENLDSKPLKVELVPIILS